MQVANGPSVNIITCMVDLAHIVADIAENAGLAHQSNKLEQCSETALTLITSLREWKAALPAELNFDETTLGEPELITKQKIVLKLRESRPRYESLFSIV